MREDIFKQESEKHESYGVLGFSRVTTSPPVNLFGSSIKHGNLICMRVKTAKRNRSYQKDWIMGDETLIEINMSASQFADAITSMNVGDGVPVTISYVKGDTWDEKKRQYRDAPPEVDFKVKAQGELKAEMKEIAERIDELAKDAKEILERKGTTIKAGEKEKLLKDLTFLVQEVRSNIPFAHECFTEAVERTVIEAKAEVDATYQTMRECLGDKVIAEHKIEIPVLGEGKKE